VDFIDSFNPHRDYIYYLYNGVGAATKFEKYGIDAIKAIVTFFLMSGIMKEEHVQALVANQSNANWYEIPTRK
jgi:hypothetical protein